MFKAQTLTVVVEQKQKNESIRPMTTILVDLKLLGIIYQVFDRISSLMPNAIFLCMSWSAVIMSAIGIIVIVCSLMPRHVPLHSSRLYVLVLGRILHRTRHLLVSESIHLVIKHLGLVFCG